MSSILQSVGAVRRKLDFPDETALPDGVIAEYLIEVTDFLVTELNQTGAEWFIASTTIDVSANEDTYPLDGAVSGLGKIRDVWSLDASDVNHRRKVLPVVSYEMLQQNYEGGNRQIGGSYYKHNSSAVSLIYNQDEGRHELIFAPIPAESCQYRVIYEPDVVRAGTSSGTGLRLRQFDALVSDKASLACLRHCKWKGLDRAETRVKIGDLRGDISALVMEGDDQFRRFKWDNNNANDDLLIGFGAGRW